VSTPHEMTRTRKLERGVEEWSCTQCSRRLLVRWPPAFEKVVLDRGDEWAAHVGAGHLPTSAAQAGTVGRGDLPEGDRSWLAAHGIGWEPDDTP
jgi:hypothetical protein